MSSLRVMIVEDEPLIGAAMEMLVEDLGGQVFGPFMNLRDGLVAAESGEHRWRRRRGRSTFTTRAARGRSR